MSEQPKDSTRTAKTGYIVTHETEDYEVGVKDGEIVAACSCGAGDVWPDKGLGRAIAATWRTRHQHTSPTEQARA